MASDTLYYYDGDIQVVLKSSGSTSGGSGGNLPDLVADVLFEDGVATIGVKSADGSDTSWWKMDATLWNVTPSPRTYGGNSTGQGPKIRFLPSSPTGITKVTATVPKVAGGYQSWTFDVVGTRIQGYAHSIHPREWTHGGPEKIQHAWGFSFDRKNCVANCYQVGGEGTSLSNRKLVYTDTFDWVAPKTSGDPGWRTSTFTRDFAPATDDKGYGCDYMWEMALPEYNVIIRSRIRCIYVYPVVLQNINGTPSFTYPSWASRYAGDSGTMFPPGSADYATAKKTWADILHARDNGREFPGIWVNYRQYNARYWVVDLDTYTGPFYSGGYHDEMKLGWIKAGYHGVDDLSQPFKAVKIADDIPIPNYAYPTDGTDAALTIVGARNGKLEKIWDIWMFQRRADGSVWGAGYARTDSSQDFRQTNGYTVSASGLPYLIYAVSVADYKRANDYVVAQRAAGKPVSDDVIASIIRHPLGCALRDPGSNVDPATGAPAAYPYPAVHNDGTNPSRFVPSEGQLVYIRRDVDLDSLNLATTSRIFAAVARVRGMLIVDRTNDQIAMLTEDDRHYGGNFWSTVIDWTNDRNLFTTPDNIWEIGRRYSGVAGSADSVGKGMFDADTGKSGYDMSVANGPVQASTGALGSDETFRSFTASDGSAATYHVWKSGRNVGAPLLIWLHGDGAYEHKNPASTYCFGGASGVAKACSDRGIVLASALSPDTTGTVTWWEESGRNVTYLADLITYLRAQINPSRIILAGYSGGAQFTTQHFIPQRSSVLPAGGSVVMGGGGAPVSPSNPTFTTGFKGSWWMHWATGALDDAAHSSEGYDALGYAKAGEAWYRGAGFATSTNWIANTTHDLDGKFGALLASALDAPH